jgi:3-methyladenine DNA glycosylase/8-oxoguanine DNA glycosylase
MCSSPATAAARRPTALRLDHLSTEHEMVELGERWRPYRSLAVSYLFASEFEEGT